MTSSWGTSVHRVEAGGQGGESATGGELHRAGEGAGDEIGQRLRVTGRGRRRRGWSIPVPEPGAEHFLVLLALRFLGFGGGGPFGVVLRRPAEEQQHLRDLLGDQVAGRILVVVAAVGLDLLRVEEVVYG